MTVEFERFSEKYSYVVFVLRNIRQWVLPHRTPANVKKRLMQSVPGDSPDAQLVTATSDSLNGKHEEKPPERTRTIILVRHGQSTFNVEQRLPGQLEGIPLTDEGRRQAQRAAIALSSIPVSAIVSSPLERAVETARVIARGFDLTVQTDERLKDTDVGHWAGAVIADLFKSDEQWKQFVQKPTEPPPGVEGFLSVQARSVSAIEDVLKNGDLGDYIVVTAHADVIKLIVAYYTGMPAQTAHFVSISNCSLSALAFQKGESPRLLALNWTAVPGWLTPLARQNIPPQSAKTAKRANEDIPAEPTL